jgi:hypothetical protein
MSTTWSSPRKPRTTALSSPSRTAVLLAALAGASCLGPRPDPLLTYFNGEYGLSLHYPASWRSEETEQAGIWYRYFLAPPAGPQNRPAVSVTLLVGPLETSVEEYAQGYLAGNTLATTREESRGNASGKAYLFASADGATRHSLLLLKEGSRVYGLYAQGEAKLFERHYPTVDEMARSLTLERPERYPEQRHEKLGFSLRIPESWSETRRFSGGGTSVMQYRSPAMGAGEDGSLVHALLTVTVEPFAEGDVAAYYEGTREKLGDAYQLLNHVSWQGGFADVMRVETPISTSRVKRYYRAGSGHGYSLSFEAREDIYPRVSRWCDYIASTLKVGGEMTRP